MKREPRSKTAIDPAIFPVEINMLFERAAYNPIRMPESGGFDTQGKAMSARMTLARWKAQMRRSKDCPKAWKDLITMIQFTNPEEANGQWFFYIKPFASDHVLPHVKQIIGTPVAVDEFWKTYTEGAS